MPMRLLLLSNSRPPDGAYLEWARQRIKAFLGSTVGKVLFIPYAAVPGSAARFDEYAQRVKAPFGEMGYGLASIHAAEDAVQAVHDAEAIVIGGGNTFHLLAQLYSTGIIELIRQRVRAGIPYIGWSAGSVVACPAISTTNDMPIIEPRSLQALGFVSFQINAHYTDVHPPGHQGETRAERINEFLAVQPAMTVIGLREGSLLQVEGRDMQLHGTGAKVFCAGCEAVDWGEAEPFPAGPGKMTAG